MVELKINQAKLAERLGVSQGVVSRYLSGERSPGIDVLEKWAEALEVSPAYLVDAQLATVEVTKTPSEEDVAWEVLRKLLSNPARLAVLRVVLKADSVLLETLTDAVRPFFDDNDKAKTSTG